MPTEVMDKLKLSSGCIKDVVDRILESGMTPEVKDEMLELVYNNKELVIKILAPKQVREMPPKDTKRHWENYKPQVSSKRENKTANRADIVSSKPNSPKEHQPRKAIIEDGKVVGWEIIELGNKIGLYEWSKSKEGIESLKQAVLKLLEKFPNYKDNWKVKKEPISRNGKYCWKVNFVF